MKKLSQTLTPDENNVIAVKYQSEPIGQLDAFKLDAAAKILLLRIHVITGWIMPDGELKKILIDEFKKKLVESFSHVNTHEIEFAFRNNPGVKDWGKNMNLALIDEVMVPYLEKRFELSRIEESAKKPQLPPAPKEEMTDQEFIELNKNIYLKTKNFALVSEKCYGILLNEDKLKRPVGEDRERILKTARAWFFKENDKIGMSHEEQERVINIFSKKIAICEYFNTL